MSSFDAMRRLRVAELDSARAWMVVAGAFLSTFTTFGVVYSFGAFFVPIAAEFGTGRAVTSTVFSVTGFVFFFLGPVTGHLADRFGPRPVLAAGALVMGLGLVLTSFIDRLWLGYLTYGTGVGIGVACAYVPMVAAVGGWFVRRRSTALGIAVAGVGCGALAVAPLTAMLIERHGWRASYVILGIASAALLLVCTALTARPPVSAAAAAHLRLGQAMRTRTFALLYASSTLSSTATFVPFVFLPSFAHEQGVKQVAAAALVGFIGGASVLGRLGLGALADRFGVLRLYRNSVLALGLSYAIWLFAHSYPWLVLFALLMGSSYGGFIALSPAVVAQFFGTRQMGGVLGTLYTSAGFGALLGPPIAGTVIDRTGSYRWAIGASMVMALAGFSALLPLGTTSERPIVEADQEPVAR